MSYNRPVRVSPVNIRRKAITTAEAEGELANRLKISLPEAHREFVRRQALLERVLYWAHRPHVFLSDLDPQSSMCDLCWGTCDYWPHLLHPRIPAPRS